MKTQTTLVARSAVIGLLIVVCLVYLVPVVLTLLYSLKDKQDMFLTGPMDLPTKLYFGNYALAISKLNFWRTTFNTILITASSVAGMVMLSAMCGYALARGLGKRFKSIYFLFVAGMLIPYQAIFVPIYMVGSYLGFVNSYAGVVVLYVASSLPFGVFMIASFMKTIPVELEQAAVIDGCNTWQVFWKIVFPLLKPAIVTLAVLRSILVWNDYLLAKMFLQDEQMQTLTVSIANLFGQYRYNANIAFAGIFLAAIPILIVYMINQKNLEAGIVAGAVKG